MFNKRAIVTTLAILFMTLISMAQESNLKIIPTFELKQLFDTKKEFTLIDARSEDAYKASHITKAINIPVDELLAREDQLPTDKKQLIVTYCSGVSCDKSFELAKYLKTMGYSNLMVYQEGLPIWTEVGYSLENSIGKKSSGCGSKSCSKTCGGK